ncbi:SDR family oxidoreductase [Thalassotalea sediminis]|uniref:SDR family oxidoreductase n=1 Tax=Thalassotalea sediminis TaxID=1759089 RepID=UPI0025733E20|nr:SDR family oxidoreductase [Thalassotalea sediminis]
MNTETTCLLTGATGGIGVEIAKALDKQGINLILQGRNIEKLEQLKANLVGKKHQLLVADLLEENDLSTLCTELAKRHDIDWLINNAGCTQFGLCAQISNESMKQVINMNLLVPMQLSKVLLPQITRNQGKIINIGSVFGHIGFPGFSSYCASKFGLRGFSETLARELANDQVQVGYFAPRTTSTKINNDVVNAMNVALGNHVDTPEFVAQELIAFLNTGKTRQVLGWPEKLFARINGILPEVVDSALKKKLKIVNRFAIENTGA